MKFAHKFDRYIAVIFFVTIVTIILTSYITFKEIINSHNKQQHTAIIPLFSLVTSEVLRPLNVAKFMANNQFIKDYVQQENIDKSYLLRYLQEVSKSYNMVAFIALEKHRLVIDSNGKETPLDSENPEWFHRLKALDKNQHTDIGNAADPHLYFDNRIINQEGEFLGFTGVAIDLNHFAQKFQQYHQRFGFELYFADDTGEVTLSSNRIMKTDSHHRKNAITLLSDLPWYGPLLAAKNKNKAAEMMYSTDEGLMISQMPIQELNWRMFIVSPPAAKQSEYWQIFMLRFTVFFIISIVFYLLLLRVIGYFKARLIQHSQTDFLTQLPNRSHVHGQFDSIIKHHETLSVVIADVDNFKEINDSFGHLVGDEVLRTIAKQLSQTLRQYDITGRWGGEEFILLLPDTSSAQAMAIVERIRKNIEQIPFTISSTSGSFSTTVSFGICERPLKNTHLEDYIAGADQALYQAKTNGRNQTVLFN